ncbi:MAG TPA: pyrroline-5-carboxylate reductase [Acidimicrobiales bacterium]|jgi:pyrroline-5-carboxylate reductase|nr:pyrroline-5-carboxylate reductase [Acidimicrobiales bacterium]MDP7208950.1 pyrroline-5-carboxylate reductase [Acidimicrobiales bacterium]HJL90147.1 pyrroline-5-carboxylate reductase [Acidimicrobiales bacterium]HJO99121.1 pyrroline-5-carboxylate reductase [Acidimicrobiales bacterium]|tara:strand:+ start:13367 stop:14155 length:789 start_codon:yes stop_codon:yes gene_type:complete
MRLQVIGGGQMGEALVGGLVASGWATAGEIHVVEPDADRRIELESSVPGLTCGAEPLNGVDALIAVKPHIVAAVCAALTAAGVGRVLSIAAGVRLDTLEEDLGAGAAVVRAMPNTPSLVGEGAAAVAAGTNAGDGDLRWASEILSAVGTVVVVDEPMMDAVTGLSGSGPAYLFLLAEALIDAGIAEGLPHETATVLTEQMLIGAATLLRRSDSPPSALRQNVTSKGGTTAAGIAVFEEADFSGLVAAVVSAASERSRELGGT